MRSTTKTHYKNNNNTEYETYKLRSLGNKILFIYCLLFTARSLIGLILQCTYLSVQSSPDDVKTFHYDKNTTLLTIQNLMVSFGQVYREIGTPGSFYYSTILFGSICYYFVKVIFGGKLFNYNRNNSLISYLKNSSLENRRISQRMDACLHQIINSNINFTQSIINHQGISGELYGDTLSSDKSYGVDSTEAVQETLLSGQNENLKRRIETELNPVQEDKFLSLNNQNNLAYEKKNFNHNNWIARSTMKNSLKQQLCYLKTLSAFKWKIWPTNRRLIWAKSIKTFWSKLYLSMSVTFWLVGQLSVSYINDSSLKKIALSSSTNEDFKRITILDRLSCFESHFQAFFLLEWIVTPVTVLVCCVIDQMKYLSSLKPKMCQIYERTRRSELTSSSKRNEFYDFKLNEQLRKDLKFECDKEALELYISYHLCCEDVQSMIEVAQQVVGQCVAHVGLSLIPTLTFYREISDGLFVVLFTVVLLIITTLNGSFCLCASLHASCSRVAKLVWNFVAFAEGHNCESYTSSARQQSSVFKKGHSNYLDSIVFGDLGTYNSNRMELDCEYYSSSSITPHTVLLFRRLVKNHEFIQDKLVCKLYGIFKIDFSGILKLNYWLMSLVLFSMTYNDNDERFLKFSKRF